MATKTTFVVFKQHDPHSVADLSGVAGDPLIAPESLQTEKNSVFGSSAVENGSPSAIWGGQCCRNFYFLKQQQKLPTFCKKKFFLSCLTKKLSSSPIFRAKWELFFFFASIQKFLTELIIIFVHNLFTFFEIISS